MFLKYFLLAESPPPKAVPKWLAYYF